MKSIEKYLSAPEWLIKETSGSEADRNSIEARFTLGNGYIGSRGILEENPRKCEPGTFFAGVYDSKGAHTSEIVNAPNPVDFKIRVGGEKLDISTMDHLSHEFILDMRSALLYRKTIYKNVEGQRFEYLSIRFFSMDNKHAAAMRIYLTPLDGPCDVFVEHQINLDTFNKGILTEGTKRHIKIMEFSKEMNSRARYFRTETYEYETSISYASILDIDLGSKKIKENHRTFGMKLKKGQTVCFTKYFSFYTSRDEDAANLSKRIKLFKLLGGKVDGTGSPDYLKKTLSLQSPANMKLVTVRNLKNIYRKGFDGLIKNHIDKMSEKWNDSDLVICGNKEDQKAMRFNIYHLLIAGNDEDDQLSIPAKTLSGEGYSGHIFWDTEIYILPFFIYTQPETARNLLMYRYYRLEEARKLAKKRGFKGAMFPWESEAQGKEATPEWFKDVVGNVIRIYTGERENHIVSDVAYGVCHYYNATGDEKFMRKYGMEIMLCTARFWASRVKKRGKKYSIEHVIGPDELHEDVKNSVFTNYCARWNIKEAVNYYYYFKRMHGMEMKKLLAKTGVTETNLKKWINIADNIKLPPLKGKVIEQFDGYFRKKYTPLRKFNEHGLPHIPEHLDDVVKIAKTQLIKQSDIVMLMVLFSTDFDFETKKKNFYYYLKRNTHKSSLSPSMEGIMAAELGELKRFYKYYKAAAFMDLYDVNKNALDGVHGASLGGVWQMITTGLLGYRIKEGEIHARPALIQQWSGYRVKMKTGEGSLEFNISRKKSCVKFISGGAAKKKIIYLYGREVMLVSGREKKFRPEKYW